MTCVSIDIHTRLHSVKFNLNKLYYSQKKIEI